MLYTFILVVQALVAASLIGVILMQKSEGGGLGVGGSPAGFLSARGAADFLSRATAVLAVLFVVLSVVLAVLASVNHATVKVDANAAKAALPSAPEPSAPMTLPTTLPAGGVSPVGPVVPLGGGALTGPDPLAGAANQAARRPTPTGAPAEKGVPLQQ